MEQALLPLRNKVKEIIVKQQIISNRLWLLDGLVIALSFVKEEHAYDAQRVLKGYPLIYK